MRTACQADASPQRVRASRPGLACLVLTLGLLTQTGCLELSKQLTLQADGSGSIHVVLGLSPDGQLLLKSTVDMLQVLDQVSTNSPLPTRVDHHGILYSFDPDVITDGVAKLADLGLTLTSVETEKRRGWQYVDVAVEFDDFSKLPGTDLLNERNVLLRKNSKGHYELQLTPPPDPGDINTGEIDKESERVFDSILPGFHVMLVINTPGKILATNGNRLSDHSVRWEFDHDRNVEEFQRCLDETFYVIFDGSSLRLDEVKWRMPPVFSNAPPTAAVP